jgi:hypothetical protein
MDKSKNAEKMQANKPLYEIDLDKISEFYSDVWKICAFHLDKILENRSVRWFKSTKIKRPSFNDFCFAVNNNIFAVLIEIIDEKGNKRFLDLNSDGFLLQMCDKNDLEPCLFQIFFNSKTKTFMPLTQSWNLIDARNKTPIVFDNYKYKRNVKITNWELNDWAVSVVVDNLAKKGMKILSFSDIEEIYPSLWFVDKNQKLNWVVVRHYLFPQKNVEMPDMASINNSILSRKNDWAAVGFKYVLTSENPFNGFFAQVGFEKLIILTIFYYAATALLSHAKD